MAWTQFCSWKITGPHLLPCLPIGQDTEAEDASGAADMDTGNGNPVDIATALGTSWIDDLQAVVSGLSQLGVDVRPRTVPCQWPSCP